MTARSTAHASAPDPRRNAANPKRSEQQIQGPGPRRLQSVDTRPPSPRRLRALGGFAISVVVIVLFGLATFNAVIVQQQRTVDELNNELTAATATNDQLRVQLTQLEAPDRIVREAKEALGMVSIEPSKVTYLTSPPSELDPMYVVSVLDAINR